jgi:hypothetical protein
MSGSSQGEVAYCLNRGRAVGGIFTNRLLTLLQQKAAAEGADVRWENIATIAAAEIEIATSSGLILQHPQFNIDLRPAQAGE